jgi:hypothetical protein
LKVSGRLSPSVLSPFVAIPRDLLRIVAPRQNCRDPFRFVANCRVHGLALKNQQVPNQ